MNPHCIFPNSGPIFITDALWDAIETGTAVKRGRVLCLSGLCFRGARDSRKAGAEERRRRGGGEERDGQHQEAGGCEPRPG